MNKPIAVAIVASLVVSGCGKSEHQGLQTLAEERPSIPEALATQSFAQLTGIPWQPEFVVVKASDSHKGAPKIGELSVIASVPSTTVTSVLESTPPWGANWRTGPVDGTIGIYCSFVYTERPSFSTSANGNFRYEGGAEQVRRILSSTNTKWCAESHGRVPGSMQWSDGNLLIVDPVSNQFWLSVWDGSGWRGKF